MAQRSPSRKHLRRRLLLRAGPLLAAAGLTAALLAGSGGNAAAGTAPAPQFAALASTAPSGLPLVDPQEPRSAGEPAEPSFPAQRPEGASDWPVADSIRRVTLGEPGLRAWIARSSAGGVCVLLYDGVPVEGVAALDVGCSAPEGDGHGATVEVSDIPGMPGKVIAAGVVPDGVTAVSEVLADGSTARSAVSGNAWARVAPQPAAAGEQPTETTGG
jgi:hypothetical protein